MRGLTPRSPTVSAASISAKQRQPSNSQTRRPYGSRRRAGRRGVAVVELAVLLPLLVFLFVITVDFARVYYFSLTLQNCARAGAMYASDPYVADESPFASTEEAALSDATNLTPSPTITQTSGTDASGRSYVEVTAAYPFKSITGYLRIPKVLNITRSVRMHSAAITPDQS
jgi:Flp pilus assembly protein TadG